MIMSFISAVYFLSRILEHSLGHYIFLDTFYCIESATITVLDLYPCREQYRTKRNMAKNVGAAVTIVTLIMGM